MGPVSEREAIDLLGEVGELRTATRRAIEAWSLPMGVLGAAGLVAGVIQAVAPRYVALWWLVVSPVATAALSWHYRQRRQRLGVGCPKGRYFALWAAMVAVIVSVNLAAPGHWVAPLSWLVVAVAYAALGFVARERPPVWASLAVAAAAGVAIATPRPSLAADVLCGASLLGAWWWAGTRARRGVLRVVAS